MTKHNKLWRRLLLLTVLMASLFVLSESPTGARGCPYAPGDFYPSDEPNACEQRCIDQFNACISDGISYSNCHTRRSCCLYLCGA